jgi:predicted nucleic acid-binding protein
MSSGVAVYDTLFVELAEREGVALATFDNKVSKAYPEIAKRPRDLG